MKKPKQPKNYNFWLFVLANPKEVESFRKRGNDRQKKNYIEQSNIKNGKIYKKINNN